MEKSTAVVEVVREEEATRRRGVVRRGSSVRGGGRPAVLTRVGVSGTGEGLRVGSGRPELPVRLMFASALGLLTLLGSCGASSNAATKENFLKAIQAFEKAHPELTRVCPMIYTGMAEASTDFDPSIRTGEGFPELAGLAKLGYLKITNTTAQGMFGPQKAVRIAVTPKFVKTFGPPTASNPEVCVGTFSVEHVDDFTAPAEMMGYRVSQVEATVKQTVTATWTKDAALTKLVRYDAPKPERKQEYVLVLKDSGWAVDSLR